MSSSDPATRTRPSLALAFVLLLAVWTALLPLLRVLNPGGWTFGVFAITLLLFAATSIARRMRLPALAVSAIATAVWIVTVTLVFARDTALLGVIPTPATLREIPATFEGAFTQIRDGIAPVEVGPDLSFLLVAAVGLLAILLDHVVITARMPLLAAVALLGVYLIPAISVPSDVEIWGFIVFAVSILALLRVEILTRERSPAARGPRVGTTATAVGIGAVAVIAALTAAPIVPAPIPGNASGFAGVAISPSLQLGEDLRQPQDVEVLRFYGDATTPPYLRAVTLSSFDGERWDPDKGPPESLALSGFDEVQVDEGIRVVEFRTTVQVVNFVSPWLPLPYPAVGIEGLDGDWLVYDENRTAVARDASPQGQDYTVISHPARPTLEQIRASDATLPEWEPSLQLEGDPALIAGIAATAQEVTAATSSDYDALIAMQRWFRGGGGFRYSLEAPVEEGFDGSGLEAVARFLEPGTRAGYCVHFASAFAIMARTLDMPSRVVVGYLPGRPTNESVDRQTIFSVSSSQLHAWPEVFFEGIGWVPFEPTTGLGAPTSFLPAASQGEGQDADPGIEPSAAPTPSSTGGPADADRPDQAGDAVGGARGINALPTLIVVLAILLALAAPGVVRALRRRSRLGAAGAGDASASWREVIDTAIDLGIPLPAGESPRALGARLRSVYGAPADAMGVVIAGIERASYAPPGSRSSDPDLSAATRAVCAGMIAAAQRPARLLAVAMPRSLVVGVGSAFAADPHIRAR